MSTRAAGADIWWHSHSSVQENGRPQTNCHRLCLAETSSEVRQWIRFVQTGDLLRTAPGRHWDTCRRRGSEWSGSHGARNFHAARNFVATMPENHVFVKLDFANAFNTLRRDVMLRAVHDTIPDLYAFVYQAYSEESILQFG